MTAAPGAALSHATLPRSPTLFSGVSGLQFFQSRLSESGVPTVGPRGLRSICHCMALMSPAAGTADIGELFLGRITWRNLVSADDDFIRQ
jgi:hypothetical protein